MTRKPGRPHIGQEPLTRMRILSAALQIIDAQGVPALTMRRLAAALGVDAMAIYHHLPNKNAVLSGVIGMVFAELPALLTTTSAEGDVGGRGWQTQVRTFAQAYLRLARVHPTLIVYLVAEPAASARASLAANEYLYAALASAGLPSSSILQVADLVVDYLHGYALGEQSGRVGQPDERAAVSQQLAREPAEAYPTLRRVLASAAVDSQPGELLGGLDIILLGVEALLGSPRPQVTAWKGRPSPAASAPQRGM